MDPVSACERLIAPTGESLTLLMSNLCVFKLMRITIHLDSQLLKSARCLAHDTGQSLTKLIEDALRHRLARRTAKPARKPATLTTVSGHGLRSGVDIDDSAALLAFMEQPHGSS